MKNGYKDSPLGAIPIDWEVVKLGEVVEDKGTYGINAPSVNYSEKLPSYLRISDIDQRGKFIKKTKKSVDHPDSSNFYLSLGDIVFARTGNTTGKTYLYDIADGELVYAGFLIKYHLKSSLVVPMFLKHYTETDTYWNWVAKMSFRSGQPGINEKEYSDLMIPLPPLAEQKRIAEVLTTVDDKIDNIGKQIDQFTELKKGLMQQLLTKGIDHTEFKDSPLGSIPKDWEVVKLKELCIAKDGLKRGPFGGAIKKDCFKTHGYCIYEQRNAIKNDLDNFRYFIDEDKFNELKSFSIEEGDLIVSCSGTIGKIAEIPYSFCNGIINQALLRIRLDNSCIINSYFRQYFISNIFQKKIIDSVQGGAMKNLVGMHEFKLLWFPLPPLAEQQKIAEILGSVDRKIDILESKREKVVDQKKGLMQKLLTGEKRLPYKE